MIGESVRGSLHIRKNMPNQDAINWYPKREETKGLPLILAVSDGHGSSKCLRSDKGSKLAVDISIIILSQFFNSNLNISNPSFVKRSAEEDLPRALVEEWSTAINTDIEKCPFLPSELDTLLVSENRYIRDEVLKNPLIAYGATLLTVLVTESYIIYLQLGDGDIINVSDSGEVTSPLPEDKRLFANETTSLCSNKAWQDFRFSFQSIVDNPPALILLSTDGYSNSFTNKRDFLKVGSDILEIIRSDGLKYINENINEWLNEASVKGSGDDITLGIIYRDINIIINGGK
jgi:serine/threonine protein phosphatase PrpC